MKDTAYIKVGIINFAVITFMVAVGFTVAKLMVNAVPTLPGGLRTWVNSW